MFVEAIKTPGIAHISYVVGSQGEACVIDPQLDADKYLSIVKRQQCNISAIIETHRNEDFISGASALKQVTGAQVYHGPNADQPIKYATTVTDHQTLSIGDCTLTFLTTPGHTKDSICILLADNSTSDAAIGVFTGDTLFVNDVGRTDFYPDEREQMAAQMYSSLQRLCALGDQVIVYPAHGSGSVCGGGMAAREFSTIGIEKQTNPLLRNASKQDFIDQKAKEKHYVAPYFSKMEQANVIGVVSPIRHNTCLLLSAEQQQQWLDPAQRPGLLIDIRSPGAFRERHVAGSINLPGDLISAYAGWLLDYDTPLAFIADDAKQANDSDLQLKRMGFNSVTGFTSSIPYPSDKQQLNQTSIDVVSAESIADRLDNGMQDWVLIDVRKQDEVTATPFAGAMHLYLGHFKQKQSEINPDLTYTCMCGSGKRATVAASYLKMLGCNNVSVFIGSLKAWQQFTH